MSTVEQLKAQLKERRSRDGGFQSQLERYRAFKTAMAEAGVELTPDRYDIPLMERMRPARNSRRRQVTNS